MPCNDGCNSPVTMTAKEHLEEAKRLRAEAKEQRLGRQRAKKFLAAFEQGIKEVPGPCMIVFGEAEEKRWEGHDTYKIMKGGRKAVLAMIKKWLAQCQPVPMKLGFDVVQKQGVTWILSWHEHGNSKE